MDVNSDVLFEEINKASAEIGEILRENEFTSKEDIQALCYEALSELFPGGGRKVIQRSKVWKIIQASINDETCSISSKTSSSSSWVSLPCPSPFANDLSFNSCSDESSPTTKCQPALLSLLKPESLNFDLSPVSSSTMKKGPEYRMYSDPAIQDASRQGKLSKPMRERLIRGTMNNMVSASSCPPFNRFPTSPEIEEMAKSLVIRYPCLGDDETCHGVVFKALKRRLSNTKPVKKPQGPTPNKRKYFNNVDKDLQEAKKVKASKNAVLDDNCENEKIGDEMTPDDPVDGKGVMDRHYQGLTKELEKKKPNPDVVNYYLNKQFIARRDWIRNVLPAERVDKLLEDYPCFRDHTEIIEETRRVLQIEQQGDKNQFKHECCERFLCEVESIIYYGMNNKRLTAPKSPKTNSKILHALQNLHNVFASKKATKKPLELVHQLQEHEDPAQWCSRRSGIVAVLILNKTTCYLVVGKSIVCEIDSTKLDEAAVALLASFYLLDIDYPRMLEIGLLILQFYVFQDNSVPEDIAVTFKSALKSYQSFKTNMD